MLAKVKSEGNVVSLARTSFMLVPFGPLVYLGPLYEELVIIRLVAYRRCMVKVAAAALKVT